MSLSAALNASVSALNSQSTALSIIASNLANSSTVGYKSVDASFSSLLAGESTGGSYSGGGVSVSATSQVTEQGLIEDTGVSTNVAISGDGFFVVSDGSDSETYGYTRAGEFEVDADGYLVSNGYYLMGWPTDADGNLTTSTSSSSLEMIDTDAISVLAGATTEIDMAANLPAEAEINDTFTSTIEIYDSLGNAATVTVTYEKTGENEWEITYGDALDSDGNVLGTVDAATATTTVTFNSDGTLATTNPDPATVAYTGWTTGAADSSITLDLGEAGSSSNLTQLSTSSDDPTVTLEYSQDGVAYGTLEDISISEDGLVSAVYSNGEEIAIYQIAVATFASANNLTASDSSIYYENNLSGTATLQVANTGSAGTIYGGSVETSTVDTNTEFSKMMEAQQAYSGAAQIMSTVSDMYDSLLSAVR